MDSKERHGAVLTIHDYEFGAFVIPSQDPGAQRIARQKLKAKDVLRSPRFPLGVRILGVDVVDLVHRSGHAVAGAPILEW